MRRMTVTRQAQTLSLPRGWYVLGAALASWAMFAAAWTGLSQIFTFVLTSI